MKRIKPPADKDGSQRLIESCDIIEPRPVFCKAYLKVTKPTV